MRKREIILDFTSLLDVTLIVIFFFVLFSHIDSQENKEKTEQKVQELQTAIEEAESREMEAQELVIQLQNDIAIVRDADERQAADINELLNFNKSQNIKLILDMKETGWAIRVVKSEKVIALIGSEDKIENGIESALKLAGYAGADTIFCDFVFDGALPGTASAYRKITKGLNRSSDMFSHLYVSETDLSIGE